MYILFDAMVGGLLYQLLKSFAENGKQLLHLHIPAKKISKIAFVYKNQKIVNLLPSQNYPYFTDTKRKKSNYQQKQKFAIFSKNLSLHLK